MVNIREHITQKNIDRKNRTDLISRYYFLITAMLSASFIILIVVFVVGKGMQPFISNGYMNTTLTGTMDRVNFFDFITKDMWLNGAVGQSSEYGIGFAIINTLIAVSGAILLSVPVAIMTSLFIAKIAPKPLAAVLRQIVELLASIPSIIYGVFGLGVISRFVMNLANVTGNQTSAGLSLLTTILVLAIMILPTITAMSETAIRSVEKPIIEGSLALGASDMQTYFKVVLTSAKSGIFAGVILGVGRALGEATAVSMVSGNLFSGVQTNLFGTTTTLTARMLLGIKETTGMDYDIRFSVGVVLMAVIILINVGLRFIMNRFGNLDE
jgi:phosphate transport system permease protein